MAHEKKKILIGYDGTKGADAALSDLRRAGLPLEAEARVIAVAEPSFFLASGFGDIEKVFTRDSIAGFKDARSFAEKAAAQIQSEFPGWMVESAVVIGSPAEALLVHADAWKPDLLVLGSHSHSALGRFFFGSVSHNIVTHAHCSIRIARAGGKSNDKQKDANSPVRIVIGVDGSPGAEAAVRAVASRRWPPGSEAHVVNALWLTPPNLEGLEQHEHIALQNAEWIAVEKRALKETVDAAAGKLNAAGLMTTTIVKEVDPKQLLLSEAEDWDADCIFIGARGLSQLKRILLGSVSTAVVMRAHCSVEVVRTP
jgi:nucleotide-binding universal stress UspA family protein